jgi:hypothetical protein
MSVTFTKLFTSITESTVWFEPDSTRLVWITMLAMADRKGRVFASTTGLAHRARVTEEQLEAALECFLAPDRKSRTKDHEGRRIVEIDGGWHLLNHEKYRSIRDDETIKESKRKYAAKKRAEEKEVEKVEQSRPLSTAIDRIRANAEAEAEADKDPSDPQKPKSDLPEKKKRVVSAYNAVAVKKGWFSLTGKPPKMTNDLLTKFCEDEARFPKLDEYMRRALDSTMEACRIDLWLRERTFKKTMSGEWGPKEDTYAKPQEELDLSKPWNRPVEQSA